MITDNRVYLVLDDDDNVLSLMLDWESACHDHIMGKSMFHVELIVCVICHSVLERHCHEVVELLR